MQTLPTVPSFRLNAEAVEAATPALRVLYAFVRDGLTAGTLSVEADIVTDTIHALNDAYSVYHDLGCDEYTGRPLPGPKAEAARAKAQGFAKAFSTIRKLVPLSKPAEGLCIKCYGTGHLAKFEHWDDGVCYACEGTGKVD